MISNPERKEVRLLELYSVFVSSPAWADFVKTAEEDIIGPTRARLLGNSHADPRDHARDVGALQAVQKLIELPYRRLSDAAGDKEPEIPAHIKALFS